MRRGKKRQLADNFYGQDENGLSVDQMGLVVRLIRPDVLHRNQEATTTSRGGAALVSHRFKLQSTLYMILQFIFDDCGRIWTIFGKMQKMTFFKNEKAIWNQYGGGPWRLKTRHEIAQS